MAWSAACDVQGAVVLRGSASTVRMVCQPLLDVPGYLVDGFEHVRVCCGPWRAEADRAEQPSVCGVAKRCADAYQVVLAWAVVFGPQTATG